MALMPPKRISNAVLIAEFAVFTILLALCVPSHIVFQEKCQLFLWTGRYFLDVVLVPGGLADWIGRFLTQFFLNPWAGAAIIAALIVVFQRLLLSFLEDVHPWQFLLSLLPAALLCAFYANENAMLSAVTALILSLLAARGAIRINGRLPRTVLALVAVPLLYLAAGPLCLIFLVAISVRDLRAALAGLPVLILTIFLCTFIFQYPAASMFGGIHYYRFLQTVRPEPWYVLASASLPLILSFFLKEDGKRLVNVALAIAVVSASFFLIRPRLDSSRSPQKEETLNYTLMAMDEDWNGMIEAAGRRIPSQSPVSVACLNLALARNGMLGDRMFHTFQNGPQGLISDKKVDFISPLAMAQTYWSLGLVDSAQRLVYEAQESIPDFQKSAYCYKWLARTNMTNGDDAVARKYLDALGHSLFYRRWRPSDDLDAIARRRLTEQDMVSSDENIHDVLKDLTEKDPSNELAAEYLLAYDMLSVNLDMFVSDYQDIYGTSAPVYVSYAEALALAWARGHVNFDGIPWALPEGTADRCKAFFTDRGAKRPQGTMKSKYGTSYWYYYFYHGK